MEDKGEERKKKEERDNHEGRKYFHLRACSGIKKKIIRERKKDIKGKTNEKVKKKKKRGNHRTRTRCFPVRGVAWTAPHGR